MTDCTYDIEWLSVPAVLERELPEGSIHIVADSIVLETTATGILSLRLDGTFSAVPGNADEFINFDRRRVRPQPRGPELHRAVGSSLRRRVRRAEVQRGSDRDVGSAGAVARPILDRLSAPTNGGPVESCFDNASRLPVQSKVDGNRTFGRVRVETLDDRPVLVLDGDLAVLNATDAQVLWQSTSRYDRLLTFQGGRHLVAALVEKGAGDALTLALSDGTTAWEYPDPIPTSAEIAVVSVGIDREAVWLMYESPVKGTVAIRSALAASAPIGSSVFSGVSAPKGWQSNATAVSSYDGVEYVFHGSRHGGHDSVSEYIYQPARARLDRTSIAFDTGTELTGLDASGRFIAVSTNRGVVVHDAITGSEIWSRPEPVGMVAIQANGAAFVVDADWRTMRFVDADGSVAWTYSTANDEGLFEVAPGAFSTTGPQEGIWIVGYTTSQESPRVDTWISRLDAATGDILCRTTSAARPWDHTEPK